MERIADRYRIDAEIGRGAGSTVYRAYDERTHALCALKVLRTTRGTDARWQRFAREVALLTRFRHPHLLRVFDHGLETDPPWMAMPLVRAGSVRTQLDRRGPLPIGDVVVHGIEALGALSVAHEAGVIHRDVKPSNLLKTTRGVAVADFGIAAVLAEPSGQGPLGSMGFMAPETTREAPSARSDLFALGVTLFVMATAGNPFDLAGAALDGRRFRQLQPGLREVVFQATRPDPADRAPTAEAMARALHQVARGTAYAESADAAFRRAMPLATPPEPGYRSG